MTKPSDEALAAWVAAQEAKMDGGFGKHTSPVDAINRTLCLRERAELEDAIRAVKPGGWGMLRVEQALAALDTARKKVQP